MLMLLMRGLQLLNLGLEEGYLLPQQVALGRVRFCLIEQTQLGAGRAESILYCLPLSTCTMISRSGGCVSGGAGQSNQVV
jgi:hypothetical protein